jgi:hypothetical protein
MVITSTSSSSGPCDTPLTASGDQTHSSAALACPVWLGNQECEPTRPRLRTKCTTLDSGVLTPRNQWCNLLQCVEYREAKEVLSLILSLLHFCPLFSLFLQARGGRLVMQEDVRVHNCGHLFSRPHNVTSKAPGKWAFAKCSKGCCIHLHASPTPCISCPLQRGIWQPYPKRSP